MAAHIGHNKYPNVRNFFRILSAILIHPRSITRPGASICLQPATPLATWHSIKNVSASVYARKVENICILMWRKTISGGTKHARRISRIQAGLEPWHSQTSCRRLIWMNWLPPACRISLMFTSARQPALKHLAGDQSGVECLDNLLKARGPRALGVGPFRFIKNRNFHLLGVFIEKMIWLLSRDASISPSTVCLKNSTLQSVLKVFANFTECLTNTLIL